MIVAGQQVETETHQEQLERLRAEVNALREQLRRAQQLATVGTMTAMVAHEMNNILTPIISYAQLARDNPQLTSKAIDRAAHGGQRATDICRALLDLSSPEDLPPEKVALTDLVEEVLAALARDPAKDGIELTTDIPGDLRITTRRSVLEQVLVNLLLNARKAVLSNDGVRRIALSAGRAKDCIAIQVRDTGVGIPPERLGHIFEPFVTTSGGGDQGIRGYGLGLAVSRDLVARLGGEIHVDSTVGRGTTFTLRLPA